MNNTTFNERFGIKVEKEDLKHFPPIKMPGVGQKELIDDGGLFEASRYMNNIATNTTSIDTLKSMYSPSMIDEMVAMLRRRVPGITESEIVLTIQAHL